MWTLSSASAFSQSSYTIPYSCFFRARIKASSICCSLGALSTHICSCNLAHTLGKVPVINAFQQTLLSQAAVVLQDPEGLRL